MFSILNFLQRVFFFAYLHVWKLEKRNDYSVGILPVPLILSWSPPSGGWMWRSFRVSFWLLGLAARWPWWWRCGSCSTVPTASVREGIFYFNFSSGQRGTDYIFPITTKIEYSRKLPWFSACSVWLDILYLRDYSECWAARILRNDKGYGTRLEKTWDQVVSVCHNPGTEYCN